MNATRMTALAGMLICASAVQAETLLERGAYLANSIVACGNCHTPQTPTGPQEGMELGGFLIDDIPGVMKAYAPNITPDVETGIGAWTDEQIINAMRNGVRPDGSIIGPPMPVHLYRKMSDRDAQAIVAYLRTVKPVKNDLPASQYFIPVPETHGPTVTSVPEVSRDDKVAYGEYLAGPAGHCVMCHTPPVDGELDYENQLGAGGYEFPGPWGVSISANITPHPDGIADYTDEELATLIRTGVRPNGMRLLPPMGVYYYANISDADMEALIAYLRALPPKPFGG